MEYADVEELTYVTIPGEPSLSLEEFDASRMLRLTSITYSNTVSGAVGRQYDMTPACKISELMHA